MQKIKSMKGLRERRSGVSQFPFATYFLHPCELLMRFESGSEHALFCQFSSSAPYIGGCGMSEKRVLLARTFKPDSRHFYKVGLQLENNLL